MVSMKKNIFKVKISSKAMKSLKKLPSYIVFALQTWIDNIDSLGLRETRKIPGFHDEPLKGNRNGQRSIRLSKSYRAIYEILNDGSIEFLEVQEVNKHEY
jgi:proteic killer suppression protein